MSCETKSFLNNIPVKCDTCNNDSNSCCCSKTVVQVDTNTCAVCHDTMRSYQKTAIYNEEDQALVGTGYKVFDFVTDENNEEGINMKTNSCGEHPLVYDCTKEPVMEDAFKTCTMNMMYFDPEECQYQYLYRFLGIPDEGDDDDMPIGNGGTDVFMKFLHPRYDLRVRLGLYETDLNLEPIKRDAGRVIHACLYQLISNGTNDNITLTPSGSGGKMSESDFFKIAQLLTYKDNDYDDYGIVKNRPQSTRTKEPPISYYKVRLCPSDADILCLGDSVDESELVGYMIYEARPNSKNDTDGDGNLDWFYKLTFVLENGREFWFNSSSSAIDSGCSSNATVCIGDGDSVSEDNTCGKSITGCTLTTDADAKEGHVHPGCIMINGVYYTFTSTKSFDVSDVDHMTFVWAEKDEDSCGKSTIKIKSREVAYKTTQMHTLGDDIIANRDNIIPIAAFQYVPATEASGAVVLINDYRDSVSLNEVYYRQQYSLYSAVKKFNLAFFNPVSEFNFSYQFTSTSPTVSHNEQRVTIIGDETGTTSDSYTFQVRGTQIGGTASDINNDTTHDSFINHAIGLGYVGASNSSQSAISGDFYFDTNQGVSITSQSTSYDYLAGLFGISTNRTGEQTQPSIVDRLNFSATTDNFDSVHIQSRGVVGSSGSHLPIFFVGVEQQD